jgi:hypothetical protein
MNNVPRQVLSRIVAKYGKDICGDARRCEGLLNDLCGSYRREINVLVNAIEERIPLDLLAANRSMPKDLLLMRLEKRLEEHTAMTAEAARWAVESWALALDLATENEIQSRNKLMESSASTVLKTEKFQSNDSVSRSENNNSNRTTPNLPPNKPTVVPRTRTTSPIIRQPAPAQKPVPPVILPNNTPPVTSSPVQTQTVNQPAVGRRGFGIFRGCLLVIFLLAVASIVLFLGVPYAIEVMRETQRERNNEPPRFPR